jgi:hypothetical protein
MNNHEMVSDNNAPKREAATTEMIKNALMMRKN